MLLPVWIIFYGSYSYQDQFFWIRFSRSKLSKKIRFFCQFLVDKTFFHNAVSATVSLTLQWLFLLSLIFLGQFLQFWNLLTWWDFSVNFSINFAVWSVYLAQLNFVDFRIFTYFLGQKFLICQKPCIVKLNDGVKMLASYFI